MDGKRFTEGLLVAGFVSIDSDPIENPLWFWANVYMAENSRAYVKAGTGHDCFSSGPTLGLKVRTPQWGRKAAAWGMITSYSGSLDDLQEILMDDFARMWRATHKRIYRIARSRMEHGVEAFGD